MAAENLNKRQTKTIKFILTDDEVELQRERGQHYRNLMTQATKDFLEQVKDRDKVGIFLSGGVDSTTVLWALLEQGVRPYCYTFQFPTNDNLSTDAVKAKHLADQYRLPFRVVQMPSDPDELARIIDKINMESDNGLHRRADFEVLPVFHEMAREARDKDGVTDIFSGIGDAAIHLLGRKKEIEARQGKMPTPYANLLRMDSGLDPQLIQIIKMLNRLGVKLMLPLTTTAMMNPYYNVPWHVMNTPRLKQITIGAWEREETLSGIKAVVSPLQSGDTNGRKYYDGLITNSRFAIERSGRQVTTAQVFYNALKRIKGNDVRGEDKTEERQWTNWFKYATSGIELPEGYEPLVEIKNGRAAEPEVKEPDPTDFFGSLVENDGIILDENGKPDTRVDCFGNALYMENSFRNCKRALAGLCGDHNPGYVMEECPVFDTYAEDMPAYLAECAEASANGPRFVFEKWATLAENNFKNISKTEQIS